MSTKKVPIKAEIECTAAETKKYTAMAMQLDSEVRTHVATCVTSITAIGKALEKLRDKKLQLWRFISDKKHKHGFKTWEEYANDRIGPMSHGKMYELVAAASLTEGENPIPKATVDKMGIKKAAEVARLEPQDRTPDIVKAAADPKVQVATIKERVQEKINLTLPADERKEPTQFFARNLTNQTVAYIEECESVGVYIEGIRDGNPAATLRDKLWYAVWLFFRENHPEEFEAAEKLKAREEARANGNAAAMDEEEEVDVASPPGPEEHPVHVN